jgi:hypothetical protein
VTQVRQLASQAVQVLALAKNLPVEQVRHTVVDEQVAQPVIEQAVQVFAAER